MAELPELETLRRELEKESVGKRFKTPEVTGTKVAKRNGGKKAFQARLEGAKVKSVDRRGPFLVGNLDNGELLLLDLGEKGYLEKVAPRSTAPKGTVLTLAFTQGGQIRLVDTSGTAQAFVVATDAVAEEAPELAADRPRSGGRPGVVDVVRPGAAGPQREAEGAPHGPGGRRRHRADLQRRDPLGGRPALRPDLQRAVVPGDPPPVPGPGRDAPRRRQAPGHHRRTTTPSSTSTASPATTRTSSRSTAARASPAAAAGPRWPRPGSPTSPSTSARPARSDGAPVAVPRPLGSATGCSSRRSR